MAIKIKDHGDHKHTYKVVKENILGIQIDSSFSDNISEALGWPDEKLKSMIDALEKFYKFQQAAEDMNKDLPESTKISILADFLKSDVFKKLFIKISTPNDYLLIGLVWAWVMMRPENTVPQGIPITGGQLLEILKGISEKKEDKQE